MGKGYHEKDRDLLTGKLKRNAENAYPIPLLMTITVCTFFGMYRRDDNLEGRF